jgi:DNA-binding YbaB/EbfC family protein
VRPDRFLKTYQVSGGRNVSKKERRFQPRGGQTDIMRQVQKLQEEMLKAQEALGEETITVTAGGGAITVVMTGHQRIQSISIAPEVVDPNDVEMLEDLITAAVNEALERSQELAVERLGALTGGLRIPGLV